MWQISFLWKPKHLDSIYCKREGSIDLWCVEQFARKICKWEPNSSPKKIKARFAVSHNTNCFTPFILSVPRHNRPVNRGVKCEQYLEFGKTCDLNFYTITVLSIFSCTPHWHFSWNLTYESRARASACCRKFSFNPAAMYTLKFNACSRMLFPERTCLNC